MKKRFVSFADWPYDLVDLPEESVVFAAECCGCDGHGEAHTLSEIASSGTAREPGKKRVPSRKRDLKLDDLYSVKPRRAIAYAKVNIGDATLEGWVLRVGVLNVVFKSIHTGKIIEMNKEGITITRGPE